MPIFSSFRSYLAQVLATDRHTADVRPKTEVRKRYRFHPAVRRLEPRFVLNASAELTSLGQLVITGTAAADYVRLDVNTLGEITIEDAFGARIDIVGNPNGQTEPLNPNDIFSKQIQINLLGGNDTLDLAIPSGLNVSVIDGEGFDSIKVIRPDSLLPNESATHHLAAQSIRFDHGLEPLDWRNQHFRIVSDTFVGTSLSTSPSIILIDGGSWEVSGRMILQSDVEFLANSLGASFELSDATLTSDVSSTTLTFDLGNVDAAMLNLGNIDDSGTQKIENLLVKSAFMVELQSQTFNLPGELSIQNVSHYVSIDSQIAASNISFQAPTILLGDVSLTTETGNIYVDGLVSMSGDLGVRTVSGDVTLTGSLDGTHKLDIDAGTGNILIQGDVGRLGALSGIDLNGSVVTVQSLVTVNSDITLNAGQIELFGERIATLLSGDVRLGAPVTVYLPSIEIRSTGSVHFESTIQGKMGSESLVVVADNDIILNGAVNQIESLTLMVFNDIRLMGTIEVNKDFFAFANSLTITQNITTDPFSEGSIILDGRSHFTISPDVEIAIGNGVLTTHGSITILGNLTINGQGGSIVTVGPIDGTGILSVTNPGGIAAILQSVGSRQPLAGVNILSQQLSVDTIVVQGNSIVLTANEIDFTGQTISTLDSGNILISGDITTLTPIADITAAESVKLSGVIRGSDGTETLTITANNRIDLIGGAQQIGSLSLLANDTIQTNGIISVNQDFLAQSDIVLISGDITLHSNSTGLITLNGKNRVEVDNMSTLSIGRGTLSVETEGIVDLANSTIASDSADAIVSVRGATGITLGNIILVNGLVDLQTVSLSTATIGQAFGTTIALSRLRITSGGDVLLVNVGNDFQLLEDIRTEGDLRVRDDVGDLTIASTLVLGTTLEVSTASSLYLSETAITANQADVRLQAGMSILNSAIDLNQYNIAGKTLTMNAVTGIGSTTPIHLLSVLSLDVTTIDGGINLHQQTLTDTTIKRFIAETGLVRFEQFGPSLLLIESISSDRDGVSIINHAGSVNIAVSPVGGNTITGGGIGPISIVAGEFIRMIDGSHIDADSGTIFLESFKDIVFGGLKTNGTQANAVQINSLEGLIVSNQQSGFDIEANSGGVILNAFLGIGKLDPLRTAVDRLTANVLSSGSININEHDSVSLQHVSTADGPINVTANGTITAINVVSHNGSQLDGSFETLESRDIKLIATGMNSDIRVVQITANNSADVRLVAGDDILGIGDGTTVEVIADDLEVISGNAVDDGILAISLSTDMNAA